MKKNVMLGIILVMLLSNMTLMFNVQPAKASGTIYIKADGSIDPPTAPIYTADDVTYTFTGDINDSITVERDNIVIDGEGHLLQGPGSDKGIDLSSRTNVTVKNLQIMKFSYGIWLNHSTNCLISGNNVTANSWRGIYLSDSWNNTICRNNITANMNVGIQLGSDSSNNTVSENYITNNLYGVWLIYSFSNTLSGNNITNNEYGVELSFSPNNAILDNMFVHDGLSVQDDSRLWTPRSKTYFNVVEDNLVNGKVLVYLEGASNLTVEEAGQVILVNCSDIRVENLNLSYTTVGVQLWQTKNTNITNNVMTNNEYGVYLDGSSYNTVSGNNITNRVWLSESSNNTVSRNNIAARIWLRSSSGNRFFHNNFIDNAEQVSFIETTYANIWDDGYPSGGNYWSDYTGVDFLSGPYQNETGRDGISDTQFILDEDNRDRYPLMKPWPPQEHDLAVSITAPVYLQLGSSILLNATITNEGLNDGVDVEFLLLINGATRNSTIIPLLQPRDSYTLTYVWTPTVKGKYNVTAYARPVTGETSIENNQETTFVILPEVGVKASDWIKIDYTITGWPAGQAYPLWLKVEFLSVEGTSATVRVTMHMSDGTEQNATVPVDVVAGGQALGLSGFVIPANLTTGDSVFMSGYGNVTIEGETTRTYAGASRTVVYASFSQYGTQLTYYWDKQTGVMVEASTTSGGVTATAKATETNMWEAAPFWMEWWLWAIVAVVIVALAGAVYFLKKRKPPTPTTPTPSAEGT